MGANMPVTLGPIREDDSESHWGKKLELGGEGYVHGGMDGQILLREHCLLDPDRQPKDINWLWNLGEGSWPPIGTESIILV